MGIYLYLENNKGQILLEQQDFKNGKHKYTLPVTKTDNFAELSVFRRVVMSGRGAIILKSEVADGKMNSAIAFTANQSENDLAGFISEILAMCPDCHQLVWCDKKPVMQQPPPEGSPDSYPSNIARILSHYERDLEREKIISEVFAPPAGSGREAGYPTRGQWRRMQYLDYVESKHINPDVKGFDPHASDDEQIFDGSEPPNPFLPPRSDRAAPRKWLVYVKNDATGEVEEQLWGTKELMEKGKMERFQVDMHDRDHSRFGFVLRYNNVTNKVEKIKGKNFDEGRWSAYITDPHV